MKKMSLAIGLCAYNEERNILHLLRDIYKQKRDNFVLENIFIVNDSSTDNTSAIIKNFSLTHKKVRVIGLRKNVGKINCMNKIIKVASSDYLIFFDCDVRLKDEQVLSEMIKTFQSSDTGVDVVGGIDTPVAANSFFGKIFNTWVEIWDTAKREFSNEDMTYNLSARAMGVSKRLYKKLNIPSFATADDQYIFIFSKKLGYSFKLARNANILYKVPDNIKEYILQSMRYLKFHKNIEALFGNWIEQYYKLKEGAKAKAIWFVFKRKPAFVILALLLQIVVRFGALFEFEDTTTGRWIVVNSTK